ncbi:hypothetical protein AB0L22_09300 [Micromonospora haikouensis]|uniref:hypothetical protein n=1 Tax=Micromonospora haikouensis TaxID=686309 RepID=UPI00342539F8
MAKRTAQNSTNRRDGRATDADRRLMATVDSESRPYTDPRANYDAARIARQHLADGAARAGGNR